MKFDSYLKPKANISYKWINYANMKVKLSTFQVKPLRLIFGEEFLNQANRNANHKKIIIHFTERNEGQQRIGKVNEKKQATNCRVFVI